VDDPENMTLWFGERVFAEDIDQQLSDDGVQPLLDEPVTIGLGLPDAGLMAARSQTRPVA
jgi:hypothetical protein